MKNDHNLLYHIPFALSVLRSIAQQNVSKGQKLNKILPFDTFFFAKKLSTSPRLRRTRQKNTQGERIRKQLFLDRIRVFVSNSTKVCLFFLCGLGSLYAMESAKNNKSAQELFLNIPFPVVYEVTNKLDDNHKESILEKITQSNDQNFIWLFTIGNLLPKEVQGHILLKFCDNNEELAAECLNLAVGALHDRKWAYDVMTKNTTLHLRNVINDEKRWQGHADVIFTDQKTVFSLAKEIQGFEKSHQKNFADLSLHNLLAIKAIIDTFSSKDSSCLRYYSNNTSATCNVRKKITWQRFKKHFKNWGKRNEFGEIGFFPFLSLAISASSRLIELVFCTKVIREDVINFNRVAQSINDYLMLAKDAAVRCYRVPLKSVQDYSDIDYLKMYSPYSLFIFHLPIFPILSDYELSNGSKCRFLLGALISYLVTYFLEREDAIFAMNAAFAGGVSILSLLSIASIKYFSKRTKTVRLNQIADLLKRTDIEIVS